MLTTEETTRVVESLLFASGDPLTVKELTKATDTDSETVTIALNNLKQRYTLAQSSLQVVEIANGFQLATRPEYAPYIGKLLAPHANRLSKPALETATIIAYRQPCTQVEIEAVRGVGSDGVIKTLLERELITEAGRKSSPGRPLLYVTTPQFLHYFGLGSLADLPPIEEEDVPETKEAAHSALVAAGVETDRQS